MLHFKCSCQNREIIGIIFLYLLGLGTWIFTEYPLCISILHIVSNLIITVLLLHHRYKHVHFTDKKVALGYHQVTWMINDELQCLNDSGSFYDVPRPAGVDNGVFWVRTERPLSHAWNAPLEGQDSWPWIQASRIF